MIRRWKFYDVDSAGYVANPFLPSPPDKVHKNQRVEALGPTPGKLHSTAHGDYRAVPSRELVNGELRGGRLNMFTVSRRILD